METIKDKMGIHGTTIGIAVVAVVFLAVSTFARAEAINDVSTKENFTQQSVGAK